MNSISTTKNIITYNVDHRSMYTTKYCNVTYDTNYIYLLNEQKKTKRTASMVAWKTC